jgi:protein SCO1/2
MISVDPSRDNPTRLKHFVTAFHPHFYAATGSPQQIQALSQPLGIAYSANTKTGIEHSGSIIVLNPEGQVTAYLTPPHQAKLLAEDYRFLLTHHHLKGN